MFILKLKASYSPVPVSQSVVVLMMGKMRMLWKYWT